ncbi:MAG: hypothetical protein J5747_09095 [Spirochaetaceae bacterium]|nr:hypothetical protein [Spirochaetaceae bacterium]
MPYKDNSSAMTAWSILKTLDVVYSTELPAVKTVDAPGSLSFVPSAAGLLMAGHIIRKLTGK